MVPNLSPLNLASVEIGKNFMVSHGYIKNASTCTSGPRRNFSNKRRKELVKEQ